MSADTALDDDDYVASLLTKSAAADNSRYLKTGLSSLLSQNTRHKGAPKPNTRFLKNLIRDTDSHNAALLAKEAEESRARLNGLAGTGQDRKRRREDGDEGEQREGVRRKRAGDERPGRWADVLGGLGRRKDDDRKQRGREHGLDAGKERTRTTHSHRKEEKRPAERSSGRDNGRHTRTRSRSPSAERQHRKHRRRRERRHSRSLSPEGVRPSRHERTVLQSDSHRHKANPRSTTKESDTSDSEDPLESIVGPRPPPSSIPRGRGAHKSSSDGIDARFSSAYDPKADVALSLDDGGEQDDWDMALEALRDRAKWKQQGAERLRAAGFSEDEVAKWEHGDAGGKEKGVDDVRWRKKGEKREWDRGKVANGDFTESSVAWAK